MSKGSFNHGSSVGPAGTSAVVLAPSMDCETKLYPKGGNQVIGSNTDQSTYCSKLVGTIAAFTFLDIFVLHHNITVSYITIALDRRSALYQSGGDT